MAFMTTKPKTPAETLRSIIAERGLTQAQAAELACVSVKTVESWLAPLRSAHHRTMPSRALRLFELNLAENGGES